MNDVEKVCVVAFDEMSLKATLRYDRTKDKIIEYEDDAGQHNNYKILDIENEALLVNITGLIKPWHQPISYYVDKKPHRYGFS